MFDIGFPELILILVIALLVFGPKKLPEIGSGIGKALREFRQASTVLTQELTREIQLDERPSGHTGVPSGHKDVKEETEPPQSLPPEAAEQPPSTAPEVVEQPPSTAPDSG